MITPKIKTAKFLFLLFTFSIIHQPFSIAEIHYVSHTGNNVPPYLTWEDAADSIQTAINVCSPGDTVIVANGVYVEKVTVNKFIWLIGMSMDSTIIDGVNATPLAVVNFTVGAVMENFTINGNGTSAPDGIYAFKANFTLRNCKVTNNNWGIFASSLSCLIENCLIINFNEDGIHDSCFPDTCHSIYRNNILIPNEATRIALFAAGGYPVFTNNIVIAEQNALSGFYVDAGIHGGIIKNNLISGCSWEGIVVSGIIDTAYIINNSVVYNPVSPSFGYSSITTGSGHRTQIKNNIITNTLRGIEGYNDSVKIDYNLFWNVDNKLVGNVSIGDSSIEADPMFIKDTIPTSEMNFDFHLQAYSPAIDKGDPTINDVDGSRSDIGMFGGPLGKRYRYLDFPPRTPNNFNYSFDPTL